MSQGEGPGKGTSPRSPPGFQHKEKPTRSPVRPGCRLLEAWVLVSDLLPLV